ncbi:MAG: protein kinase [Lachnospiraceae bacterium]|nr:protein kinase [Lachnospiraceae bacterium]
MYRGIHKRLKQEVIIKKWDVRDNISASLELTLLKSSRHPQIPRIFDFIKWNADSFIVMEKIDGSALDKIMKNHVFSLEEICIIGNQICDILEYFETFSPYIVHGDIKPSNLIIQKKSKKVFLIDFDAAVYANNNGYIRGGTPKYLPRLKQLSAGSGKYLIDNRIDIYALAETLKQLLKGNMWSIKRLKFYFDMIFIQYSIYSPLQKINPFSRRNKFALSRVRKQLGRHLLKKITKKWKQLFIVLLLMTLFYTGNLLEKQFLFEQYTQQAYQELVQQNKIIYSKRDYSQFLEYYKKIEKLSLYLYDTSNIEKKEAFQEAYKKLQEGGWLEESSGKEKI